MENNENFEVVDATESGNGTLLGIGIGVVGTVLAGLAGKYVVKPLAAKAKAKIADAKEKKAAKKEAKDQK